MTRTPGDPQDNIKLRLTRLGLHGLVACFSDIADKPWLVELIDIEEQERKRRSLERRLRNARIGMFKPLADYDWLWAKKIDREAVEDLFTLQFLDEGTNAVFVGPSGVGKTMIVRNLAHHALIRGHTVRFVTASDMLAELAAQDSSSILARRFRRFTDPKLLCLDEVGYLSYDSRYADLLFEVVTRRYETRRPIVITTNKPFAEWSDVFPHAACVVTLVDRLIHRAEIIDIQAESYRLKEASERAAQKATSRRTKHLRA